MPDPFADAVVRMAAAFTDATPNELQAIRECTSEAEQLAQDFHETYERLAPRFGYETRRESAKPWAEVPEQNRGLMTAVCGAAMLPKLTALRHQAQSLVTDLEAERGRVRTLEQSRDDLDRLLHAERRWHKTFADAIGGADPERLVAAFLKALAEEHDNTQAWGEAALQRGKEIEAAHAALKALGIEGSRRDPKGGVELLGLVERIEILGRMHHQADRLESELAESVAHASNVSVKWAEEKVARATAERERDEVHQVRHSELETCLRYARSLRAPDLGLRAEVAEEFVGWLGSRLIALPVPGEAAQ